MATPPTPSNTAAKPTLLTLPAELRNHIYRLSALAPYPISLEPLCLPTASKLHQPSLSFVNHQLRHEVLSLYYSETTFYLGKIGYHSTQDIRLYDFELRLQRWTNMLGPWAERLKDLEMGIDSRCYAWSDVPASDASYSLTVVGPGRLKFEKNGSPRCTCRLKEKVEERASGDGRVLLQVMREYSKSYCEAVHEGFCTGCGKSRLEKMGRTEVRHLPLWEDIVVC